MFGGLEHLKIQTRSIDERFVSVMGECVILTSQVFVYYDRCVVDIGLLFIIRGKERDTENTES